MGKRSKKHKSLNVLKSLMEELSLGSSSSKTDDTIDERLTSTTSHAVSGKTKHFILAPSHPFYWHLSNRENRPKDAEESSTSEYPDSGSQSEGRLVIRTVKNVKKRHKVRRRLKKNKTKTSDLTATHSSTSRPLSLEKTNRKQAKQAKRAAKKLRSQKVKRRSVNKTLANELNQLSLL